MYVSWKAAYFLLERYYTRVSLQSLVSSIPPNVIDAALLFAAGEEEYEFMQVFRERLKDFDDRFACFDGGPNTFPIVLPKEGNLNMSAFAAVYVSCNNRIPQSQFEDVIESQCSGRGDSYANAIYKFRSFVEELSKRA